MKGNSLKFNTLRRISLLSVFISKVIEKLNKNRFCILLSFNFLWDRQYGFTKGKSTEDDLI